MMMPANFSAISENEMTYVNSFLGSYVSNTVGTLFGRAYKPGNLGKAWFSGVSKYYNSGYDAVVGNGTDAGMTYGNTALGTLNGALNAGLRIVGSAAAIYNLATANVKNGLPSLFDFTKNETVYLKD